MQLFLHETLTTRLAEARLVRHAPGGSMPSQAPKTCKTENRRDAPHWPFWLHRASNLRLVEVQCTHRKHCYANTGHIPLARSHKSANAAHVVLLLWKLDLLGLAGSALAFGLWAARGSQRFYSLNRFLQLGNCPRSKRGQRKRPGIGGNVPKSQNNCHPLRLFPSTKDSLAGHSCSRPLYVNSESQSLRACYV